MNGYPDDDRLFDTEGQENVLRLVAARSSTAGAAAATALRSTSAAARQLRLDRLLPAALGDESAKWTSAERQMLSAQLAPVIG